MADGDRAADAPREGHGLGRPDADERDEREHVEGADARMDPAVLAHVDQGDDPRGQGERGALDGLGRAQERDD